MPAGIIPNEGVGLTLSELLGRVAIPVIPWKLMLWVNDIVPGADTVLADLTEPTFVGYGRAGMDRDQWTEPTVSAGCAHSEWGTEPVVFTVGVGAGETVYGCAYVDELNGVLRYVQRFDDDDIIELEEGMEYKVPPQYTLTSAECA